jgi:hypothetical protein
MQTRHHTAPLFVKTCLDLLQELNPSKAAIPSAVGAKSRQIDAAAENAPRKTQILDFKPVIYSPFR